MLNDQEIERAAAQLADYRRSDALAGLLDQYAVLIEDYKRLKSDYEEERETREKYKQMAKDQERNPFVLVLVDGDGYVFNDTLLSKRAEGGSIAAQMLNEEIKVSLRRKGLEHCQVMVRVYANVFGLSKAVAKAGVAGVGGDSRSLGPFIASFNRAYGLTEFVDAGELKENADSKLRALLRLYADNTQCKHIFFAACHDVGYISELTPFMGNSSKFTLVDTPGIRFHNEFTKLGMGIEEFRRAFRHAPLDGSSVPYRASNAGMPDSAAGMPPPSPAKKPPTTGPPHAKNGEQKTICTHYPIGKCRYGKSCKLAHIDPPINKPSTAAQHPPADLSPPLPPTTATDTPSIRSTTTTPILITPSQPWPTDIPPNHIPLSINAHRLDPPPPPSATDPQTLALLKSRIDRHRVCNSFHLTGTCDAGATCAYDHDPLPPACIPALAALARTQPCPRRGECRVVGCTGGHVCYMADCRHRGGKGYCRIPYGAHGEEAGGVVRFEVGVESRRKGGRKAVVEKVGSGAGLGDGEGRGEGKEEVGGDEDGEGEGGGDLGSSSSLEFELE